MSLYTKAPKWTLGCPAVFAMLSDFRYAVRALRHKPGFALTAILSIALGIGANASIFSFVDGILFRPLQVPHASEVLTLGSISPSRAVLGGGISWPDYLDFRDQNRSFRGLAAYEDTSLGFAPDTQAQPQLKAAAFVSANFFRVLDTEPRFGRGFRTEEDQAPGRDAVVILGYDFWNVEFKADPAILGREIRLDGLPFTIVGVVPESFNGINQFVHPAFYVPASMAPALVAGNRDLLNDRSIRAFTIKGRLKPGVSVKAASAEAASIAKALEQSNPRTNRSFGAAVRTELQSRLDLAPARAIIPALMFGLVGVLLAIACANVANLMLSRARSRSREIAVRLAIGASRLRLLRQLMAESLCIAIAGGAFGLLIARLFVEFASKLQIPGDVPISLDFQLDARVLWFTVAVSIASALLFGLSPALESIKTDLVPALKTGEADHARKRLFGRSALVTLQVAGSLVLLVMAAELYGAFSRQMAQNPGFRRDHILTMTIDPSLVRYSPGQTRQFYQTLIERARGVTGIRSAALASSIPTGTNPRFEQVVPEGFQFPHGQESTSVWTDAVDENYFETMAVPLLRGRRFLSSDTADSAPVAIVNEAFARHFLGGQAIGKRLRVAGSWIEVVGVAATGKYLSEMESPTDALYIPFSQHPSARMTLLTLTGADPASLAAPLQDMVRSIDPSLPVFGVRTMQEFFEQRSVKAADLITNTVASIGLVGLALALIGLYAVVAYQVAGRTREIGIRMAIGAAPERVMNMILKQAAVMSVTGVAIGLVVSLFASRAIGSGLAGLVFDPLVLTLTPIGLLVTTLIAAAIPARRAARVDPMSALRQD